MTKMKWWLRAVGGFYLLLVVGSLWVLFISPRLLGNIFPYSADETAIRAFSDAWLIFVLEMFVLGIIMLYASRSRQPERNGILVVTIALLELIRGAGGDLLWMTRGFPTANYIPFMIAHAIIAGTGIWFWRQESV